MGKKSKKAVYNTTTVETKVIKLSYLQTLAISNNLSDISELETDPDTANLGTKTNNSLTNLGLTKKKKKTNVSSSTTGLKVKDTWLQPEFNRIRYAIGVKEFSVSKYEFAEESEIISVPYLSPKEIIKAHLVTDEYIPPQFDKNIAWVKYYIKVEGTDNWININPLNAPTRFDGQSDIIPKIINFNIPQPTGVDVNEEKFQYTDEDVKKIRVRIVLSRPTDDDSNTPLVKSYRLVLTPRS